MLVLVDYFQASYTTKLFFPTLSRLGLLVAIPILGLSIRNRFGFNRLLPFLYIAGGMLVCAAAFAASLWVFIALISCALFLHYQTLPVITEIFSAYNSKLRGKRYSIGAMTSMLGILCFSGLAIVILNDRTERYPWLVFLYGLGFLLAGIFSLKAPPELPSPPKRKKGLGMLEVFRKDPFFAYICFVWFLMGTANLWLAPYRVNLLLEKQFGFEYSSSQVLTLTAVIPFTVQLLFTPVFASLFDRVNFIALRITLNACFAFHFLFYFCLPWLWSQIVGMVFLGIAFGGGRIAWNLWVTKIAKPTDVSTYMGIHTTLTGIRMISVPVFGYYTLSHFSPQVAGSVSVGLLLLTIALLLPCLKQGVQRFSS